MLVTLRYAALVIPRFRLQAVRPGVQPVPSAGPVGRGKKVFARGLGKPETARALVDPHSSRSVIVEVDLAAHSGGVAPGMSGSQALARMPGLQLLHACASAETRLSGKVRRFCESLSPHVEKRSPAVWMLDLRGMLIPEWEAWGLRALENLRLEHGVDARLGIAPKPALALCAARRAEPVRVVRHPGTFVEELGFEELGVSDLLCQKLHDWGVRVLGDLLRLPRQAALERLGPEAAGLWEIALDTRESVLRLEIFEEALEQHASFEQPLETVEPLVFSLNRIVEQLCSRLRLVQRVASGMHLELQLENGASHRHRFTVPAPNREEAVLLRILQTHLETLQFDAAVTGVRLRLDASLPDARQLALFESPLRDPNRFGETLGRLRALAGNEAVGVPLLAESHRSDVFDLGDPLERFGAPILGEPLFPNGAWQTHGTAVGLPLRRFRPPVQACVHLLMHQPKHVMTKEWEAPVLECRGPYRKCGDWWAEQAWSHEEWDVRLGGRAAGMYRLARSLPPCSPPLRSPGSAETWWMEGCYDGAWWPSPGNPC